jgi:3-oxoacyl-[acyl-carrier-protein] synthase II
VEIFLKDIKSVSSLGYGEQSMEAYRNLEHAHTFDQGRWMAPVQVAPPDFKEKYLQQSDITSKWAVRLAADLKVADCDGVFMASSRGATRLWEEEHKTFLATGEVHTLCSPHTTLGNIASTVAQYLGVDGPNLSFSNACSSFSQGLIQGSVWIKSGMAKSILVGASEFACSNFTQAQIKALKIATRHGPEVAYPNEAFHLNKTGNTLTLGEGAVVAQLVSEATEIKVAGIGYGLELIRNPTSVNDQGTGFQKAMLMALGQAGVASPDVIIAHAPGTIKGDQAEHQAILAVFGKNHPLSFSNKWKVGHTYGASSGLSLALGAWMLHNQTFACSPFTHGKEPKQLRNILINAMGFGGNVTSILLQYQG